MLPLSPKTSSGKLAGRSEGLGRFRGAGGRRRWPSIPEISFRIILLAPSPNLEVTMVRLMLSIKADLENVTDLTPSTDSFEFFFQVQCNSCHETHPKFVGLNRTEEHELSGSKGNTAHFVWRCGMCKRESSAKFDSSFSVRPYTIESSGKFAPLLVLDCRGLEFTDFDPRGIWRCTGAESGTTFNEVDLDDREWTDYDEKSSLPVGIMEIEAKWTRA